MFAIISAGIAPGVALLSYFYLKDEYETEPLSLVLRTFLFGAILVFPIMFIQHVLRLEGIASEKWIQAFLSSGLLEEFVKWFIVYFFIFDHEEFDEPYDGIVYSASVSLGFATLENILYLLANGVEFAVTRALLPVSSHALFAVMMGFYLGKAKFQGKRYLHLALSFLLPFLLHGTYDFILFTQEKWGYYMVPFMLAMWWMALRKVKQAKGMYAEAVIPSVKGQA
ncbi:protease prsW [Anoxybacillus sp. B7M1]|jgi:protease PrsW|uniref:Protease PrsW n=1 Tax=Anoxybacteroides rupiense TaxID=311460 RepID=A0ABD5IVP9_9BACL|nr:MULTISPECIES: glutamic-type intramembrane protease PrsW [Anoxybacillus]ANB56155.1 protease prsW [Anoxybacillus sp. B2M1]ANB64623.1 protease prsW [Anoxybacillus sp. B7M1]KXG11067.1 Protease PrsW [Anoxybacillus sp. P3H1B]MBB3906643.1 RsiW-degrading membrane proteinase PrsW (M82 family) [Anoxybacillus rupiensis]MBS2770235.1 intramembrane metalloprotease PrsW [Anoxybacillus rupiensis]